MQAFGFKIQEEAMLQALTLDVVKSSEIEGKLLNEEQVRSSIARRLGIEVAGTVTTERDVEGVVEMMLNATQRYDQSLSQDRIFGWHAALFPTGRSGMYKIKVADWRDGPTEVVSGAMGRETVHFKAPHAKRVPLEMNAFLHWLNDQQELEREAVKGSRHKCSFRCAPFRFIPRSLDSFPFFGFWWINK